MMNTNQWAQVKHIFSGALELRPEDRPQFVIEASAGDGEIRREVEKLLGWFDSRFMEEPAVSELAAEILGGDRFSAGQTVSHYRIDRKLGSGGMGEVYLARDTKLDRMVAVKFLSGRFSGDQEKLNRFIREAKATSSLNHPHIVTVYEVDQFEGAQYIATEFVEGDTLRDRLIQANEPVQVGQVLKIAIEVAEALSAAHQAGIVHRDIKPENIMIRRDGYVKVLDFGLAKLTAPTVTAPASDDHGIRPLTETDPGTVMGTASYMSPEQARGRETDSRSDIWSLGVVLYEMLAGRLPFEGETVSHTIVAIFETEPGPIEGLPAELQRIITRSLEKDREKRYQTAQELSAELRELRRDLQNRGDLERSVAPDRIRLGSEGGSAGLSTDPDEPTRTGEAGTTTAASDPDVENLAGKRRRRRIAASVTGFILSAFILTAAYLGYFPGTGREIASIAVMPFENNSGDPEIEYLSDGMTETLINSLSSLPNLDVRSRTAVFSYKGAELDTRKIADELNVESVLTGRISQQDDQLTLVMELVDTRTAGVLWSNRYEGDSLELASLQSEIARDVANRLRARLSGADKRKVTREYTADPEAYRLYLQGLFYWNKHGRDDFKKAVEYYEQALEKDPEFALAYAGMAMSYVVFTEFGVETSPRESLPMAKAAALKAIELDPTLAEPHTALGLYHRFYTWDLDAAERELRKAIELNPNYATAHQWLSLNLAFQGRYDESIAAMERAGELDPLSKIIREERGYVLFLARRYDDAITHIKDTQAIQGEVLAGWSLARIYLAKGMYKEAIEQIRNSTRIEKGPSGMLVCALVRSGQRKEALKMLEALESKWETRPEWHTQGDRAAVYTAFGDKDKAFYWLNRMLITRSNVTRVMSGPELDDLRNDPRFEELKRRIAEAKMR